MVLTCVYTLVSTFFIYHEGEGMTTLKRILHILLILLALTTTMRAAQPDRVVADGHMEHCGDSAFVMLTLNPEKMAVEAGQMMTIRPHLIGANHNVSLPAIHILGRHPYYRYLRGQQLASTNPKRDIYIWEKNRHDDEWQHYAQGLPFRPWMDSCRLVVIVAVSDECATTHHVIYTVVQEAQKKQRVRMSEPKPVTLTDSGTAYIQFPNNDTRLLPEWQQNKEELGKITESISKVLNDKSATLLRLHLHGYASPDGPLADNRRFASERVDSVKKYIVDHTPLAAYQIKTESTAEDWAGLLHHVEQCDDNRLPHHKEIIGIINDNMGADQKEQHLRTLYPEDYAYLLENVLPRLRRTDYQIDYTRREMMEQKPIIDSIWHMPDVTQHPSLSPEHIETYKPIVAVKTNLLWWAAAAPNIEFEVPFGKRRQWSVMAEMWCPWYVWHNNSRAYEVMLFGAELRHWYGTCRDKSRAPLTGLFLGLYAAGGKYDLEWNSKGDQGEFYSGGLTIGYSWPIHRRLNLELSGSVGALGGPRRHYKGMADDTRLVKEYDSSTFYAGPTKLKLSIVWLLGNKGQSVTRRGMEKERQRNRKEIQKMNDMWEKVYKK